MARFSRLKRVLKRLRKKKLRVPYEVVHKNDYEEMEFQFD